MPRISALPQDTALDDADRVVVYDAATDTAKTLSGTVLKALFALATDVATAITGAKARANHTGTQTAATISDLTETVQDIVGSEIVAGANVTATYDDTAGTVTIAATGGGSGQATYFNVKAYGAAGDNSTDDTSAIQDAIDAALASENGHGTVYFPAGMYLISAALVCTGGGKGVTLRGDGPKASTIAKNGSGFCAVTWNGSGGPSGSPTAYGGLIDISIEGRSTTGGLVQTNSAQQMFFRGFSLNGGTDFAMDLNTMQDSSFIQWSSNSVHPASGALIKIYGSANGNTNQLFFSHFRIEDFYNNAIKLTQGSGSSNTNDGFYFSDFKLETGEGSGDFVSIDTSFLNVHIARAFGSLNSYKSGYATPMSFITSGAYQSASYRDIWFGDNIGGQVAALNITPSGSDFGRAIVENVWYGGDGNTGAVNFSSTISNMGWTIIGCGTSGSADILSGTLPYNLTEFNNDTYGGGRQSGDLTVDGSEFINHNTADADAHFGTSGGGSLYVGNNVSTGGTVDDATKAQWRIAFSQSSDNFRIDRSPIGASYTPATLMTLSSAGLLTIPTIKITGGSPGSGKVLTSDADGDATWETPTSGGSGITRTVTSSSGSFTAAAAASTDYVYILTGAHVPTLPTAVGNTNRYTIKNNHSAAITVLTTSSQTVDGGTLTINPGSSVDLISNNANWFII